MFFTWRNILSSVSCFLISGSVTRCYRIKTDGSEKRHHGVRELEGAHRSESVASSMLSLFVGKADEVLPTNSTINDAKRSPPPSDVTFTTEKDSMEENRREPIDADAGSGHMAPLTDALVVFLMIFICIVVDIAVYVVTLSK
eukprot:TRINITY_DN9505_c0_g1_i1.p1 TRINITY_DN9505_c0_g1~~TRINITY_DN9505_c0_g1_i1.p1  ORF type:complete len:142 (-),score=14.55 TRINITY_DN9505_c0_g1_i1:55-480(-)